MLLKNSKTYSPEQIKLAFKTLSSIKSIKTGKNLKKLTDNIGKNIKKNVKSTDKNIKSSLDKKPDVR